MVTILNAQHRRHELLEQLAAQEKQRALENKLAFNSTIQRQKPAHQNAEPRLQAFEARQEANQQPENAAPRLPAFEARLQVK